MNNVIRNLINAYDSPVLFSDAQQGTILFANNEVHQKLGFPENKLTGTSLKELLKYNKIIQAQSIWKHNEDYYLIQNEKLTLEGYNYIKSVLKPFPDDSALPGATFQKEITRHLMHRLRSPLNATLGFNKLLKENGLSEKQLQYATAVEKGLNDLKSVLSQIEVLGQTVTVQKTAVEFKILAEQVLASFSEEKQKRIEVIFDAERKVTDYFLILSIIEELAQNAFEHSGSSSSAITLHFGSDRIRVNNTGNLIPEELKPKIFFPFFSGKARGMGIGLAKCSYYANHLGVKLKLSQNSPETGVSFDIIFSGGLSNS